MNPRIYREADADASRLDSAVVAIIGYGNQGRAHALNLRDSGVRVVVGQRPGRSFDQARADGFAPVPVRDAAAGADWFILTLPDETAADVYAADLAPSMRRSVTLGFVHGFNIRFGFIQPPAEADVIMVAPKGPGALVRSLYEQGKGVPALFAVHQDASGQARQRALAWAAAIGATRAGVVETTFAIETETDLFGEQAVLCGGLTALAQAGFETLVEAGYPPEFAYLECVHELKQIADLLYHHGLSGMRRRISNTAEYGDVTRGPRVIDDHVRARMREILTEVRDGRFAREWLAEARAGAPTLGEVLSARPSAIRASTSSSAAKQAGAEERLRAFEQAGAFVRSLMPWLSDAP